MHELTPSEQFAATLEASGLDITTPDRTDSIADSIADCSCCSRRDSTVAKRYLDSFGDSLRCWVCWSADSIRHPLTGDVRYIADRVRNNWLKGADKVGYPNADSSMHGVAPVCFWHNDPTDVAAGILRHKGAHERALTLVSGGTYADLL